MAANMAMNVCGLEKKSEKNLKHVTFSQVAFFGPNTTPYATEHIL